MENNKNEELQSRREFFKKAAKAALPVVGFAILGSSLISCEEEPKSPSSTSCSGCSGSCKSGCSGSCQGNCSGDCDGGCTNNCDSYCGGDCWAYCESVSKTY